MFKVPSKSDISEPQQMLFLDTVPFFCIPVKSDMCFLNIRSGQTEQILSLPKGGLKMETEKQAQSRSVMR